MGTFICYIKSRQYEGNIRQTQIEENSIKYKKCQDNQKEGKSEKPSQSKEPKETWWLNVMQSLGWGSGTEKKGGASYKN